MENGKKLKGNNALSSFLHGSAQGETLQASKTGFSGGHEKPRGNDVFLRGLHSQMLALEPRIVFDAAVGATGADLLFQDGRDGIPVQDLGLLDPDLQGGASPESSIQDAESVSPVDSGGEARDTPADQPEPSSDFQVTEDPATPSTDAAAARQIVFLDSRNGDYPLLTAGTATDTEIILLTADRDGLSQITAAMSGRRDVQTVTILAESRDTGLLLGSTVLNDAVITNEMSQVAGWGDALGDGAVIEIVGTGLDQSADGRAVIDHIAALTGAEVTTTGNLPDLSSPENATAESITTIDLLDGRPPADPRTLLFIDTRVENYETLAQSAEPGARVILINPGDNGVMVVSDAIGRSGSVDSVHIFTHGGPASLSLGSDNLNDQTLESEYLNAVESWSRNLTPEADILIYGCDVAEGAKGQLFVERLSELTGADVAASDDPTGAARLGGDWVLEKNAGNIETAAMAVAGYDGLLTAAPTIADSVPTTRTTAEDTPLTITGVSVADADNPAAMSASFTVSGGTVDLAGSGWTVTSGADGSSAVTISGNVAQINAALDGMVFTPSLNQNSSTAGYAPKIDISLSDTTNSDGPTTATINLAVTADNDNPVISGSALTVQEGQSNAAFSLDQLAPSANALDPDIATGQQVVAQQMLTLDSLPGKGTLTYKSGPVVIGSVVPVSDLANLKYTHNGTDLAATDTDSFNVTVNDGGGGATSGAISINITPVNVAPSISGSPTMIEGQVKGVAPTINLGDSFDTLANSTIVIDNIVDGGQGTLFFDANSNNVVDGGEALSGTVTLSETQRSNLATQLKFYQNGAEPNTPGATAPSYRITATDAGGGTGTPSAPVSETITIHVDPNNDDPTLTNTHPDAGSALSVTEGTKTTVLTTAMLQIADADRNPADLAQTTPENQLVFTIGTRPTQGEIQLNVGGGLGPEGDGWIVLGEGGRFTQADIAAGKVRYYQTTNVADAPAVTTDSFTFTVRDSAFGYDVWTDPANPTTPREGGLRATPTGPIADQAFFFSIAPLAATDSPRDVAYSGLPRPPTPGYSVGGDIVLDFKPGSMTNGNSTATWNEDNVGAAGGYAITQSMLEYTITRVDNKGTSETSDDVVLMTLSPDETVYTLTTQPPNGTIQRNFGGTWTTIVTNGQFTQQDINDNLIRFVHDGSENHTATFGYKVSDGTPDHYSEDFEINITPTNDRPTGSGGSVQVIEKSTDVNPANDGLVRLGSAALGMSDVDLSLDAAKQTGEGAQDFLWFKILAQPADSGASQHGELQRWDGDSWETVVPGEWLPGTLLSATPDGGTSGLRYAHDGSEPLAYPTAPRVTFQYAVRDDLADPGDPWATNNTSPADVTGSAQSNQSATATATIYIIPVNNPPAVADKPGDADPTITGTITNGGALEGRNVILADVPEGGSAIITSAFLTAVDKDNTTVQRQYKITSVPTLGTLKLSGNALGKGSTFTQDDIDNNRLTYFNNGDEVGSPTTDALGTYHDKFHFTLSDAVYNDTGAGASNYNTFLITLTPRNDPPILTTPANLDAFASGTTPVSIPGITLADSDLDAVGTGETDFMRIEVQVLDNVDAAVTAAQLNYSGADPSGGSAFTSGKGSNSLVVQGTKTQIDAVLASLTVAFTADDDAADYKIRVIADDRLYDSSGSLISGAGAGANGGLGTTNADGTTINAANNRITNDIVLRASNFNDVPTISNAGIYSVNEDAQLTLSGFTLSDVDSFGEDVTVTVRLYSDAGYTAPADAGTQGRLILGATTGLTSSSGDDTNTITLTGSVSEVQTALNLLKFQGAADFNNGPLYLRTEIADFTHADGQKTTTLDHTITLVPVNDQPTLSVPGNKTLDDGTSLSITSGFAVGDAVDVSQGAADYVEVTVAATESGAPYGTISVTAGSATVTGDGTDTIVVKGTTAAVQAALNTMVYTPANPNVDSTVTLTTTVDDLENGKETTGVGGNNTNAKTFTIDVSGTNDAPVVTAPATLTVNEDSSANPVAGVSFADSDDFGALEKVTLDLGASPKGSLTLTTTSGLTFTTGDGTADTKMVFTGTKASINAALATLRFTPTADINTVGGGNVQSLTITADDQGNTGTGGAISDTKTIAITINPLNDSPTRTAAGTTLPAIGEDNGTPSGDRVTNLFTGVFSDSTDTQAGGSAANGLAGVAIVGNASTAAQGKWQYNSGSGWTDLPASPSLASPFLLKIADEVRFLPAAHWNGTPGSLTVRLIDDSSGAVTTGAGPNLSAGGATGGTTVYSDSSNAVTLNTTVTAVNDAPVASGTSTLSSVNEDTADPPGSLVSSLITGANYSDATDTVTGGSSATVLGGIAIVANGAGAAQGTWQYSTDNGDTWNTIASSGLGDTTALILPTAAKLRFMPASDFSGTPGDLSVRLADSAQVFSASSDISGSLGGTSTWSSAAIPITTSVAAINDPPTISALSGTPGYTENDPAAVRLDADGAVTVADPEMDASGSKWQSATLAVQRSGSAQSQDVFSFIDDSGTAGDNSGVETSGANLLVDGVTVGTFTNTGGKLTVTFNSSATASDVGKVMGAVAYRNSSDAPPAATQINFVLNDKNSNVTGGGTSGGGQDQGGLGQFSAQSSVTVGITRINDAPTISALDAVSANTYTENGAAVQIDGNVLLADPELDAANWKGATLTLARSGGASTDDVFGATGTLTLTGSGSGNVVVSGVTVGTYTQSGGTLSITFNSNAGASRADSVIRGLTYRNASDDPPALVTLAYTVNDQNTGAAGTVSQGTGGPLAASGTIDVNITRVNDAPVISAAPPSVGYTENAGAVLVDPALTLSDSDDTQINGATVTISSPVAGDTLSALTSGTGITASFAGGVLTLSGVDTVANYQQVLRSVGFSSTSDDPTFNTTRVSRTLTFSVTDADSDGAGAQTTTGVRAVDVTPVNDTPTLTGAGSTRSYTENAAAVTLEPGVILADADDTQLNQAVVSISNGFVAGDRLNFTDQLGITGSYNAATGVLTLSGTASLADYQAALRSIGFDSTSENPGSGGRSISWTVRDVNSDAAANGQQTSLSAATSVNVTPVNDDPAALNDGASIGKATVLPVTGSVLPNDTDVDGGTLTVTGLTGGTVGTALTRPRGTLTINADGTYSFAVNTADPTVAALGAGATLTEDYTYTISDGQGGTASATLTVTIHGANNPPTAGADSNSISEGTASVSTAAGGVLTNDSDINPGDTLAVTGIAAGPNRPVSDTTPVPGGGSAVATGTYGSLTLNANGSYTYTLDNTNPAVQALSAGQNLLDNFTYVVSDGKGGSATANLVITINGTNDGPDAVNDASSLPANAPSVNGNALANDSDPDAADTLSVSAVTGGTVGAPITGTYGSLTLNADGSYSFVPNGTTAKALAAGVTATDVFTYTASDGTATDTATITITLTGVNDTPTANADANEMTEDQANASGNVLSGSKTTGAGASSTVPASADSDPDTVDTLSVIGVETAGGSSGAPGSTLAGAYGSLTLNADGSYAYVLNTADPAVQALKAGETRDETFTYTISDGKGGTSTATLAITITGNNDAPVGRDDSADTTNTASVSANVLPNDFDPDANPTLTVTGIRTGTEAGAGTGGTVGSALAGTYGALTLNGDGSWTYTPSSTAPAVTGLLLGQSLTENFTYTLSDGTATDTAQLTITLNGTNQAPAAVNDAATIAEETASVTGSILANDSDPDGDPLTVIDISLTDGTGGVISTAFPGTPLSGLYGEIAVLADGSYTYSLDNTNATIQALKAGETLTETFVYTTSDGRGAFVQASLVITVTGTNDAPVAAADTNGIAEDSAVPATGNVLSNDSDPDANTTLSVSAVSGTGAGSVGGATAGSFGILTLNSDGTYSYALDNANPAVQALGPGQTLTDTFTYTASDGAGGNATTTLTLTINGDNEPPTAVADVLTAQEDGAGVTGDLTPGTAGQDADADGGTITVHSFANADGHTGTPGPGSTLGAALPGTYGALQVASDGSVHYAPDNTNPSVQALGSGEGLTESFTYTISDGQGGYSTSTVTVTINGVNDAPTAAGTLPGASSSDGLAVSIPTAAGFADVDSSNVFTFSATGLPTGLAIDPATGAITGTLDKAASQGGTGGVYTVTVTAKDSQNTPVTQTFTFTVTNPGPVARNDAGAVNEDATLTVSAADGVILSGAAAGGVDTDVDGDSLTVTTIRTGAAGGTGTAGTVGGSLAGTYGSLTLNADGSYTYVADNAQALAQGQTATDTFTYTVGDGQGGTATATLTVTVTGVNYPPVLNLDPDNSGGGANDGNYAGSFSTGDAPLKVLDVAYGGVTDVDDTALASVTLTAGGIADGASEVFTIGGTAFSQDANKTANVTVGGTTFTVTYTAAGGTFVIVKSGGGDMPVADVNTLLRGITYENQNGSPTAGDRTLQFKANDGDADSNTVTSTIIVNLANDPPSFVALDNTPAYTQNGAAVVLDGNATISDPELDPADNYSGAVLTLVRNGGANGADQFGFNDGNGLALAGNQIIKSGKAIATWDATGTAGKVVVTFTDDNGETPTANDADLLLQQITYRNSSKALGAGRTENIQIDYTLNDGNTGAQGSGGAKTGTGSITVTMTGANDPPVAASDTNAISENATAGVAGNVLANDTDPDLTDTLTVTGIATAGGAAGTVGTGLAGSYGTLTLNPDGTYSYTVDTVNPAVKGLNGGQTLNETYTYTVDDGQGGQATAQLTITITGVSDAPAPSPPALGPTTTGGPGSGGGTGAGVTTGGFGASSVFAPVTTSAAGTGNAFNAFLASFLGGTNQESGDNAVPGDYGPPEGYSEPTGVTGGSGDFEIYLIGSIKDQLMIEEREMTFSIPRDVFQHRNQGEELFFEAVRPDGSPLPDWISFNIDDMTFSGTPPRGTTSLDVVVIARDKYKNEARAQFRIIVNKDVARPKPNEQSSAPQGLGRPTERAGDVPDSHDPFHGEPYAEVFAGVRPHDGAPPQAALESEQIASGETKGAEHEGRDYFTAQLRASGRYGMVTESRALLNSLLLI